MIPGIPPDEAIQAPRTTDLRIALLIAGIVLITVACGAVILWISVVQYESIRRRFAPRHKPRRTSVNSAHRASVHTVIPAQYASQLGAWSVQLSPEEQKSPFTRESVESMDESYFS